jgi:hypothetical protein
VGNRLNAGSESLAKGVSRDGRYDERYWWTDLLDSIRTEKSGFGIGGRRLGTFEQIGKSSEQAKVFNDGMVSLTGAALPSLLAAYDFSGIATLMDVGGGFGQLMIAIRENIRRCEGSKPKASMATPNGRSESEELRGLCIGV